MNPPKHSGASRRAWWFRLEGIEERCQGERALGSVRRGALRNGEQLPDAVGEALAPAAAARAGVGRYPLVRLRWPARNAFADTSITYYDRRSAILKQIDAEGRTTYFEYDLMGRQIHQSNALGEQSYFGYDARSSRVKQTNPRGNSTTYTIDKLRRTTHQTNAIGGVQYYGFDQVGNRVLTIDELGNPTYLTYNALRRTRLVKDATGAQSYMHYDAVGQLRRGIDADGRVTTFGYYGYDAARRQTRMTFSTDPSIYYTYDSLGNLTQVDDESGASTLTHDKRDRLTKKVTKAGAVYYEYDKAGMKARFKDPALKASYLGYDAAGRLAHMQLLDGTPRAQYYQYDKAGRITKKAAPSSNVLSYYTYDVAARLQQLVEKDSVLAEVAYYRFFRNENGAVTKILRESSQNVYYTFDALDRLTDEVQSTSTTTDWKTYFEYDAASSRKRLNVPEATTAHPVPLTIYYDYDSRTLLTKEHKLLGVVSPSKITNYYTYDSSQRMEKRFSLGASVTGTYFTYNQRAMVTAIRQEPAGSVYGYQFTGTGERVVATADGSVNPGYWAYDGGRLVFERNATSSVTASYRHNQSADSQGSSLVEIVQPAPEGGTGYPGADQVGSVRKVVRPGFGTDSRAYDFFGVEISTSDDALDMRTRFLPSRMLYSQSGLVLLPQGGVYNPAINRLVVAGPVLFGPRGGILGQRARIGATDKQDSPDDLDRPDSPEEEEAIAKFLQLHERIQFYGEGAEEKDCRVKLQCHWAVGVAELGGFGPGMILQQHHCGLYTRHHTKEPLRDGSHIQATFYPLIGGGGKVKHEPVKSDRGFVELFPDYWDVWDSYRAGLSVERTCELVDCLRSRTEDYNTLGWRPYYPTADFAPPGDRHPNSNSYLGAMVAECGCVSTGAPGGDAISSVSLSALDDVRAGFAGWNYWARAAAGAWKFSGSWRTDDTAEKLEGRDWPPR